MAEQQSIQQSLNSRANNPRQVVDAYSMLVSSVPDLFATTTREAAKGFAVQLRDARWKERVKAPVKPDHSELVHRLQEYVRGIQAGDPVVVARALREVSSAVQETEKYSNSMQGLIRNQAQVDTAYQEALTNLHNILTQRAQAGNNRDLDAILGQAEKSARDQLDATATGKLQKKLDEYLQTLGELKKHLQALRDLMALLNARQLIAGQKGKSPDTPATHAPEATQHMLTQLRRVSDILLEMRNRAWQNNLGIVAIQKNFVGRNEGELLGLLDTIPSMHQDVLEYERLGKIWGEVQLLLANPGWLGRQDWQNYARSVINIYGGMQIS